MAKQDRETDNLANIVGGMGRARANLAKRQFQQQRPIATPQMGTNTPAPQVSKAKAMNDFAHANDFLKRYDKPKAAPAKKAMPLKARRGR